ncbi:DUF6339 family protein [Gordonia sp. NPDC003424]
MSRLYPRLLHKVAAARFAEFASLELPELTRRAGTSDEGQIFTATGGSRISAGELGIHREQILDIASSVGFPDSSVSRAGGAEFDTRVARYLHENCNMVPAEAASADVWSFWAVVLLPDVAYWRFPEPGPDRIIPGDLTRHTFGRLWWRAQLIHEAGQADSYEYLSRIGGESFGQIYERRTSLGASPTVVRSIIRVWDSLGGADRHREEFRDSLKRLLRLGLFVRFPALSTDQLDAMVRNAAQESLDARSAAYRGPTTR